MERVLISKLNNQTHVFSVSLSLASPRHRRHHQLGCLQARHQLKIKFKTASHWKYNKLNRNYRYWKIIAYFNWEIN